MKHSIPIAILAGAFALAACEPEETVADAPAEPTSETPPPETTTTLEPEPAVPGIVPRVKAELDRRDDGATGPKLAIAGARGAMQTPAAWTTTSGAPGTPTLAKSQDGKAHLAATGDVTKLDQALEALGLTDCRWAPTESIVAGRNELSASAADGLCKRGDVELPAAQLTVPDASILAVGVWEKGSDDAGLFATLRSVTGVAKTGGGVGGIAACCAALEQNRKSAPPEQQGYYASAIGICRSIQSNPQARAMLGQVQGALRGANVPAACR